ncbi:MAG: GDP-mannose 4,6-dehydratase, partial [Anaerolineae bacterium]|nr:GDP-mannose 4,6-dehydratase [Anaerolineae bacterium]
MRVLITGASGFVGRHLVDYLASHLPTADLHGTTISVSERTPVISLHHIDLKEPESVRHLLQQVRPDCIYHLAAQASPRRSFMDPWGTLENNIRAQLNVLQACVDLRVDARLLIISSAEIYQSGDQPIPEDAAFNPTSPYGVSKIAQDMLALQYYLAYQLPVMRARPFNHIGPGQGEGFVAPDFAMQIARIEAGQQQPVLEVGNLSARRDFTDVRDVVRAYHLIVERGQPGQVYNVASGDTHSIQELLDTLLSLSTRRIEVRIDPTRFLPVDVPVKCGDANRLRRATGWEPAIPFQQTLLDVL